MERTKKMVLIPHESLQRMQSQASSENGTNSDVNSLQTLKSIQTVGDNFSRLDNEMKNILDSTNFETDDEKFKEFLQKLQRYLFFMQQKRNPVSQEINKLTNNNNNSMSDEVIISTVPKIYQKKVEMLIKHLKNKQDRISWNKNGTVAINEKEIKDSNIVDLINDAARHRKKVKAIGRKQFAAILREIDTPREYVGNTELWNLGASFAYNNNRSKSRNSIDEIRVGNSNDGEDDNDDDDSDNFDDLNISTLHEDTSSLSKTVVTNDKQRRTSTPISKRRRSKNNSWKRFKI